MANLPLYLTVSISPRLEMLIEAKSLLQEMIAASLEEKGCEQMEFLAHPDDSMHWMIFEKWRSKKIWERHATSERAARDGARLTPMLVKTIDINFYIPI